MKQYTQSDTTIGNCWQTAVACILEIDPNTLPPQCELELLTSDEKFKFKLFDGYGSYSNILNGYLGKHHNLIYTEIPAFQLGSVRSINPYHMLVGPTERTAKHRANGRGTVNHVVVAKDGEMVWDPHPSRAGLIDVEAHGVLGSLQQSSIDSRNHKRCTESEGARLVWGCLCPACGLTGLRDRIQEHLKITQEL